MTTKIEEVKKALDRMHECGEALKRAKENSRTASSEEVRCANKLNDAAKAYNALIKSAMEEIDPRYPREGKAEPVLIGDRR
jgi:hypothetical protein